MSKRGNPEDWFWQKVWKTDGCWIWTGGLTPGGYASFGGRKAVFFSLELRGLHRPIGCVVMHTCDNKLCVNPDHLRVGTQSDNIRDSVNKGRHSSLRPKDPVTNYRPRGDDGRFMSPVSTA